MNRNTKYNQIRFDYVLLTVILILCIIKQLLVANLPIIAATTAIHDDNLLVERAYSILDGKWLGEYGPFTLSKGCFFSLFLAVNYLLHIPYIYAATAYYSLACIIFTYGIKPIFKSRLLIGIVFAVLLFNPASLTPAILSHLYATFLPMAQGIWVIGCFAGMYFRKEKNLSSLFFWAIVGGIGLAMMMLTRDDAIWILPFIIIASIIYVVSLLIILGKKRRTKEKIVNILVILVPFLILFGCESIVRSLNTQYYGVNTVNESSNTYYAATVKLMYSIDAEDSGIRYVSMTRDKLKKLYKVSPTLADIESTLELKLDEWGNLDHDPGDDEVEDGFFTWAFHQAVEECGYYDDGETSEEFFENIYNELLEAVDNGDLTVSKYARIPVFYTWRKGYLKLLLESMNEAFKYVFSLDDISTKGLDLFSADDREGGIKKFEEISGDYAIYPGSVIYGWYMNYDREAGQTIYLVDKDDNVVRELEWLSSDDVYNMFAESDIYNDYFKHCRFRFSLDYDQLPSNYSIRIEDADGNEISTFPLNKNIKTQNPEKEQYNFDYIYSPLSPSKISANTKNIERAESALSKIEPIIQLYRHTLPTTIVLSVLCYFWITFCMILCWKTKVPTHHYWNSWLLLTGIFLSFLVLIIGVCYIDISSCDAIFAKYLSAVYPLMIGFIVISITQTVGIFTKKKKSVSNFKQNIRHERVYESISLK